MSCSRAASSHDERVGPFARGQCAGPSCGRARCATSRGPSCRRPTAVARGRRSAPITSAASSAFVMARFDLDAAFEASVALAGSGTTRMPSAASSRVQPFDVLRDRPFRRYTARWPRRGRGPKTPDRGPVPECSRPLSAINCVEPRQPAGPIAHHGREAAQAAIGHQPLFDHAGEDQRIDVATREDRAPCADRPARATCRT